MPTIYDDSVSEMSIAGDFVRTKMTPAEYVQEIVLPTAHQFRKDPRSRRLMSLTCMAVFHIADHLKNTANEKDVEEKMRSAVGESFDLVRAICNGTKHARPDNRNPIQFSPGDDLSGHQQEQARCRRGYLVSVI